MVRYKLVPGPVGPITLVATVTKSKFQTSQSGPDPSSARPSGDVRFQMRIGRHAHWTEPKAVLSRVKR